jgi:hypothetical protein
MACILFEDVFELFSSLGVFLDVVDIVWVLLDVVGASGCCGCFWMCGDFVPCWEVVL